MEISLELKQILTGKEYDEASRINREANILPFSAITQTATVLAKENNVVVGYTCLHGYSYYDTDENKVLKQMVITAVMVDKEHRNVGLPTLMHDYVCRHLKGYQRIALHILPEKETTIKFYEECGFQSKEKNEAGPMLRSLCKQHGYLYTKPVGEEATLTLEEAEKEKVLIEKDNAPRR